MFHTPYPPGMKRANTVSAVRTRAVNLALVLGVVASTGVAAISIGCASPARVGDVSADNSLRVVAADEMALEPGAYARVFQAARDEVRARGWEWERVDLEQGVISSAVAGAGARGIDDLANRHNRQVRVTFAPASPETDPDRGGAMSAMRASELGRPMMMRVSVTVFREQVPGWQPQSNSARLSGRWTDPELQKRELQPSYSVAERQDQATASELIAGVLRRSDAQAVARPATGPATAPATRPAAGE